jgi:Isoprenylcysteine carboxyl methyltransferase (ICMT) family
VVGGVLICVTFYVMWLVTRENSFAAPVVKVQKERGHKVVTTGPYAFVRHPMYGGVIRYSLARRFCLAHGGGCCSPWCCSSFSAYERCLSAGSWPSWMATPPTQHASASGSFLASGSPRPCTLPHAPTKLLFIFPP